MGRPGRRRLEPVVDIMFLSVRSRGLGTKEPNPFSGSVGAFLLMLDKIGMKYV
jgi:hypothetical protein